MGNAAWASSACVGEEGNYVIVGTECQTIGQID